MRPGPWSATPFAAQVQGARRQSFTYPADGLADGSYTLIVSAVGEDGRTGRLEAPFAVDRTLSGLALSTSTLTPNGDGVDDTLGISFTLAAAANVVVQIEQAGAVVAPLLSGSLLAGPAQLTWDGTTPSGPAPAGTYDAVVLVDGPFGRTRHAARSRWRARRLQATNRLPACNLRAAAAVRVSSCGPPGRSRTRG